MYTSIHKYLSFSNHSILSQHNQTFQILCTMLIEKNLFYAVCNFTLGWKKDLHTKLVYTNLFHTWVVVLNIEYSKMAKNVPFPQPFTVNIAIANRFECNATNKDKWYIWHTRKVGHESCLIVIHSRTSRIKHKC